MLVALGLRKKRLEITKPVGIQKAKTCKMAFHSELLRGCRKEKKGRRGSREGINQLIFRASLVRQPLKVMRLIDDQQIPSSLARLGCALRIRGKKVDPTNHQLAIEKRIFATRIQGGTSLFIKNTERHLETAEHFHEPLVQ